MRLTEKQLFNLMAQTEREMKTSLIIRFTEKETNDIGLETGFYRIKKDHSNSFIDDLLGNKRELNSLFLGQQKLGQLEDYEEKIEMPLVKFLEWRINNLIPYFVIEGKIKKAGHYHVYILRNIIEVWDVNLKKRFIFHYKDYGKSWALTKEELL